MITRLNFLLLALLSIILLALAGCGGSGGGSSKGALVVVTDWTNHSSGAVIGQSQRVSLYTLGEQFVIAAQMNQDLPGVQQLVISDIPKGTYHLKIELYLGRDLSGSQTGVLDTIISIQGSTTFANSVGNDVTTVKVTPATATVQASKSQQFYAAGYAANNQATFVAPGSISWQVLGGVGTVNATGFFSATSQGSGSVVATHTASSTQGGATVTVTPFSATQGKWTILVFMNAANNLAPFSGLNMNQMEKVAGNPQVRFLVQWKESLSVPNSTFNTTRRYLVKPDTTSAINSEILQDMGAGIDMGDKQTLTDFINWGKTFYPAERYVLVIWNHGNGWRRSADPGVITRGVSYDDETGNSIKTWELAQALGNGHFDILAWDASLMQMTEVNYEIKDKVDFIAGSEESPPGAGYPYDLVFKPFRDTPTASTVTLSKAFVDGMLEEYADSNSEITQSVIDTSKLGALASSIDNLGTSLIANVAALQTLVPTVRAQAQAYKPENGLVYRDLWDVCNRLQTGGAPTAVSNACGLVKTALDDAVVWEGHNLESPGSHGLSIDFSSATQFPGWAADYNLLRFSSDTSWNEWLAVAP
jgi:hypothetical protein